MYVCYSCNFYAFFNSDQDSTVVNGLCADCTTCVLHGDAIISRSDFIALLLLHITLQTAVLIRYYTVYKPFYKIIYNSRRYNKI